MPRPYIFATRQQYLQRNINHPGTLYSNYWLSYLSIPNRSVRRVIYHESRVTAQIYSYPSFNPYILILHLYSHPVYLLTFRLYQPPGPALIPSRIISKILVSLSNNHV